MPGGQADHLQNNCNGEDDCRQDGSSSSSSGRQADGGSGMGRGVQAAEGWGVRPGSRPQASKWLACPRQQQLVSQSVPPIPEEQPLTSNEFLSGFQAGYNAAYLAGWEQGYHMGRSHTLQMQQDKQYQGYQTNRRGACPDCSEEDEPDNKTPKFWTDTKWEPYKEDIQQVIRSHLTKYGQDLREKLAITIDLDEGN